MYECPDRDCHEKVSRLHKFIWGEENYSGAAARLDALQECVEDRLRKPSPIVLSLLLCLLLPIFGWAWNTTVTLENRITKLENQYELLQQIDNNIQKLIEQAKEQDTNNG